MYVCVSHVHVHMSVCVFITACILTCVTPGYFPMSHVLHCLRLPPICSPCCCSLLYTTGHIFVMTAFSNIWRLQTSSSDLVLSFEPCPGRQIGGWTGQMLVMIFLDLLCPKLCEWCDFIANKYICQANMSVSYQVSPSRKVGNENHVPFFFCFPHAWNFFGLTMCWRSQSVCARGASVCREKSFFLRLQAGCLSAESWIQA